ncbi:zinc finger protein ZFP2-like isoform X1 [Dunckerocampus dactyliophorus]|uniref:zinc finger protein ZFP2-like isoform X1 n=1 Tax=Dunckerocampus dactyliophorus TaxID=161453 RepID=UPI0024076FA7|nr:zinc finger protein ZFP2-like isoform X1 [Dunckerocampus dactyliophorus]
MNHRYAKMATSSQREGGRESAPPTPSKSSTEKKPQTADNDVQHLIGPQEEHPTQPQGGNSTLKKEDSQPPHIKKEDEELRISPERKCLLGPEEADLPKLPLTVVCVKTEDHEDKPPESLHWLCPSDVQQLIGHQGHQPRQPQGGSSTLKQEESQPPPFKEEEEELWITQDRECLLPLKKADLTKLPLTGTSLSREADCEDVQQLIGPQEDHPTQPQGGTCTLKQEEPHFPHIKKEDEELRITPERKHLLGLEEDDVTKFAGASVKTEDHEDKLPEFLRWLCPSNVQQLSGRQEERPPQLQGGSSTLKEEDSQPLHIKKEEEELWTTQAGERLLWPVEADLTNLPLPSVSVKTEDHEDKPPESSQLQHSPNENRGAKPPSNRSPQHMTTEADGDHCGGSQADKLLAPLSDSDDTTSHSPHDEDWDGTQGSLSNDTDCEGDMKTQTDNKHPECSKKKTGKKCVTCSVCAKNFFSKRDLTRHMLTHTGEKPFSCSVCAKSFPFKWNLSRHMRTHKGEKSFSCSFCAKSYSSQGDLTRHIRTHTGEKPFSCSVCGKSYLSKRDLTGHIRTHTGEKPFRCSVCDKSFSLKCNLSQHTLRHTGEKPFDCSVCGQRFCRKSQKVLHMRKHTGEKPFGCSVCVKRYSFKGDLTRHMLIHTQQKSFICSVCPKRFLCKSNLTRHMRTHMEKPFVCSVCGKGFLYKGELTQHMLAHTGETPFGCSFCEKSFSSKWSLNRHMQTHTGEKMFGCSVCGQRFFQKSQMVSHMRKHTGEKPFGCSVCAKSFSYKGDLTRHMLTHMGEKPFGCSVCAKRFSQKCHLTQHMLTHRRKAF